MPRPSPVRDALSAVLEERGHAVSLEELHRTLVSRGTAASFSAVYRAAEYLEQQGRAVRVDLGDGLARYERAGEHHEHVRCTDCGAVAAVPGCLLGAVAEGIRTHTGFEVSAHALVLSGRCSGCRR